MNTYNRQVRLARSIANTKQEPYAITQNFIGGFNIRRLADVEVSDAIEVIYPHDAGTLSRIERGIEACTNQIGE